MIGQRLLHYEITEKLGQGGMGVVYKARDTHLDRFVAIKVLPPGKVADPARKARFVQEAKAASALNHRNIVTIHDISSCAGVDFIAMEFVEGKTLDQLIPRKGMRLNEALNIAVQIADAMSRAHSAGIIHRDLKPANIMVDGHGTVKVLDFGLAKLTEQGVTEDDATVPLGVRTEEGAIVGTAAYMSPEQADGKPVDPRSDIFSFGSVLYEMITGQRAFRGGGRVSTLSAVLHKEPEPMGADVPRELERIVQRCIRKDPARRFHHVVDLKVELDEVRAESDSQMPAAALGRGMGRRRYLLTAAAVAVPLLAAAAWFVALRSNAPVPPPGVVPLTSYPGLEAFPSFSPDGNQVAFSWDGVGQDNFDIYVKLVGSGTPLRLTTDPAQDSAPAWSPDGRQIAFLRGQGERRSVYLSPPVGGSERKLTDFRSWENSTSNSLPSMSWSPNGKWLAIPELTPEGAGGISLISVERGERRRLTSNSTALDHSPAFSPDGQFLAYASCTGRTSCDVHLSELGPDFRPVGEPRRLTDQRVTLQGITWTADGRSVVYAASRESGGLPSLWRAVVSGASKPVRLELAGSQASQPVVSRAGNLLAYVQGGNDSDIWMLETGSAAKNMAISSTQRDNSPQFSPDGSRIVFASSRTGINEIWVCGRDGSNLIQLTNALGRYQGTPRWSPDGRWIVFDSLGEDGHRNIYVVDAAGGQPRQITLSPGQTSSPSFSRDGKWIYYYSVRSGRSEVYRIPVPGGQAVQVTDKGGFVAFESWDGRTLYYTKESGSPGSFPLFARPVGGGPERQVLDSVFTRAFVPVEDGIYYIAGADKDSAHPLRFLELATGKSRTLARLEGQLGLGFSVSPDRKTFLFCANKPLNYDLMLMENFR